MPVTINKTDSLQLQERDIALLRGLFESRVMTARHIGILYFDNKSHYTKKRLQKIKVAGLIGERRRRVNEPSILFLTRKGFALLRVEGALSEYPSLSKNSFEARVNVSELTLRHELEIMDVKAAFHEAVRRLESLSILEFTTWPLLFQFESSGNGYGPTGLIKPDGYLRIHEREAGTGGYSHDCFLEVDRSSEKLDVLINRAIEYREYYRSGRFAERNGALRSEIIKFPFRVLIVLKSAERRNNLAERLAARSPAILSQTWLTTLAEATSDPLGPIWVLPRFYRAATGGTPFETGRTFSRFAYRRQQERENFVESNIRKLRFTEEVSP